MRVAFKENEDTLRISEVSDVKFIDSCDHKTFEMRLSCEGFTLRLKDLRHDNPVDEALHITLIVKGYCDLSKRNDVIIAWGEVW